MNRREFIKRVGIGGLAAIALGAVNLPPIFRRTEALAADVALNLEVVEALQETVDANLVYSWAFAVNGQPSIPGPVIYVSQGDNLTITVTNTLDEPHGFAIPGLLPGTFLANTGPISSGGSATVSFLAPNPGTYIYLDPENDPVNRVLGLHGVLVVKPTAGNNPYGAFATPNVASLFNDLGNSSHFPGVPWAPNGPNNRERIWVFSEIDPEFNLQAQVAGPGEIIDRNIFQQAFLPTYFTINGQSGYFAANNPDIALIGLAGEPILIRNVHVGLDTHSPHIHANHGYIVSVDNVIGKGDEHSGADNIWWMDTWTMLPLNRKDVLYPMMRPPDIPPQTWAKQIAGTSDEGFVDNLMHGPNGGFPIAYPMHSHQEISQSANGGNYPKGLITHIEFHGALPGV
ncbi:MAG: multicopper oxidase domain-containing protein [Desulfobaccales bacterium]